SDFTTYAAVANGISSIVHGFVTALPDNYTTPEDTQLTVSAPGVLANDSSTFGQALTASLVTNPIHGSVVVNAYGPFTYTPNPNYNGPDSFTYRATSSGGSSAVGTVTLIITPVNDPPIAAVDNYVVRGGQPTTVVAPGVLANDSDPDGDPITAVLAAGASN